MNKKKATAKQQTNPKAPAVKKPETLVSRAQKEQGAAGSAGICRVYCGPTMRNVAKQFTVYSGELPEALTEFLNEHPAAKSLVVPVQQFATMRRDVQTLGTPQHTIYQSVFREISGKQ